MNKLKRNTLKHLILLTIFIIPIVANAQSRGTKPGEIYDYTIWYYTETEKHDMIIYSDNYGKNFRPIHVFSGNPDEIPVGEIYADAKEGVLYNSTEDGFYVSFNNGASWELEDTPGMRGEYTTGTIPGEIFKCCASYEGYIWQSINFADTFMVVRDSSYRTLEVGTNKNELYAQGINNEKYTLCFSNDNGKTFIDLNLNEEVGGTGSGSNHSRMTHGTTNEEIYWIAWNDPGKYKIFRSTDFGQDFKLQYEQPDTANFFYEYYSFTAGRSEGEFYVFKNIPWFDGSNTKLHVYYSNDYAKTFTEYIHVFDKDWTKKDDLEIKKKHELTVFPNPVKGFSEIISTVEDQKGAVLKLYDIIGKEMQTWRLYPGVTKTSIEAHDYKEGVYFLVLIENGIVFGKQKLLIQE